MIQLNSKRLQLRELVPDDVTRRYVDWLNDPEINRYLEVRHFPQTMTSTLAFVQSMKEKDDDYLFGVFRDGDEHIGNIRLGPVDRLYRRAVIGLMIGDRAAHGQGYGSEAINTVCLWAFHELRLHKLEAGCYAANVGSLRAFEKVGFKVEGRLRHHWWCNGEPEDQVCLGLIESEFDQ